MARMVQIEKVGVTFETKKGPFVALRDIDLTVEEGEVVSLTTVICPATTG